ncbi:MAG TPA: hypothetical protein DEB39_09940 [Planctomycetaceae bacterium]|nr:hypothetical protein [Planctomycetaceae bacterium]
MVPPPDERIGRRGRDDEGEEDAQEEKGSLLVLLIASTRSWAASHKLYALILSGTLILFSLIGFLLVLRQISIVRNRPTLELAVARLDYGAYLQARNDAEVVLQHAGSRDPETKGGALYVIGVATCYLTELSDIENKTASYLSAANYLQQSLEEGFLRGRQQEGYFYLGKSLYMAGEMRRCRQPLITALELGAENQKAILWYLANAAFYDAEPDYDESLKYASLFRKWPSTTREEVYEGDLLETTILLQKGDVNLARKVFESIPELTESRAPQLLLAGRIAMEEARIYARQADYLERVSDPTDAFSRLKKEEEEGGVSSSETIPGMPRQDTSAVNHLIEPEIGSEQPVPDADDSELPPSPMGLPLPTVPEPPNILPPESEIEPRESGVPLHGRAVLSRTTYERATIVQTAFAQTVPRENAPAAESTDELMPKENTSKENTPDEDTVEILGDEPLEAQTTGTTPAIPGGPTIAAPPDAPLPIMKEVEAMIQRKRDRATVLYAQADALFQETIRNDDAPFRWARQAALLQGVCYEELHELRSDGDLAPAQQAYNFLIESFPDSSEAIAAGFLLAEIQMRLGRNESTLAAYRLAFERLKAHPEYVNGYLTKSMIFSRTENVFNAYLRRGDYDSAIAILEMLRPVMPSMQTLRLGADALNRWADALRRQAEATFFEERDALNKKAEERFRLAGRWYGDLARYRFSYNDYDDMLWSSAENYRAGRDYRNAIRMYEAYMKVSDRMRAEALYKIGDMYFELDFLDETIATLKKCVSEFPRSTFVPRARLILSKAYREKKEWEEGVRMLQLNLSGEYAPTSAIFRDTQYALGALHFDSGDYDQAIVDLEDAISFHPEAPQAAESHYDIARAYLGKAQLSLRSMRETPLERTKERLDADVRLARSRALDHYRQCEAILRSRQDTMNLGPSEQLMLRNAMFGIGTEAMSLQRYDEAIFAYDLAATQYQNSPDALYALVQIANAYRALAGEAEERAGNFRAAGDDAAAKAETDEMRRCTTEAVTVVNRAKILHESLKKTDAFPPGSRLSPFEWEELLRFQERLAKRE